MGWRMTPKMPFVFCKLVTAHDDSQVQVLSRIANTAPLFRFLPVLSLINVACVWKEQNAALEDGALPDGQEQAALQEFSRRLRDATSREAIDLIMQEVRFPWAGDLTQKGFVCQSKPLTGGFQYGGYDIVYILPKRCVGYAWLWLYYTAGNNLLALPRLDSWSVVCWQTVRKDRGLKAVISQLLCGFWNNHPQNISSCDALSVHALAQYVLFWKTGLLLGKRSLQVVECTTAAGKLHRYDQRGTATKWKEIASIQSGQGTWVGDFLRALMSRYPRAYKSVLSLCEGVWQPFEDNLKAYEDILEASQNTQTAF
jgi:hypothetical protein